MIPEDSMINHLKTPSIVVVQKIMMTTVKNTFREIPRKTTSFLTNTELHEDRTADEYKMGVSCVSITKL